MGSLRSLKKEEVTVRKVFVWRDIHLYIGDDGRGTDSPKNIIVLARDEEEAVEKTLTHYRWYRGTMKTHCSMEQFQEQIETQEPEVFEEDFIWITED
jgi:hypothetical protein